jgi:hypothetical protein
MGLNALVIEMAIPNAATCIGGMDCSFRRFPRKKIPLKLGG